MNPATPIKDPAKFSLDPATILLLFNAALTAFEKLSPIVKDLFAKGDVSPDEQAKVHARLDALRLRSAFEGPEWEPSKPA